MTHNAGPRCKWADKTVLKKSVQAQAELGRDRRDIYRSSTTAPSVWWGDVKSLAVLIT
jgi:hypothetical protein